MHPSKFIFEIITQVNSKNISRTYCYTDYKNECIKNTLVDKRDQ